MSEIENTEVEQDQSASFEDRLLENLHDEEVDESQPEQPEQVEKVDPLEAPEFFSKEHKEVFQKLQEIENGRNYAENWLNQYNDGQKYITKKSQKLAEERKQYEQQLSEYNQIQQATEPLKGIWQSQAIAPAMGMAQLAHYGRLLYQDPQALIQEIASGHNVDLNKLIEDQPYEDPETRNLKTQVQQLQQHIGQFQNQYQQGQTQQQQQAIHDTISNFVDTQTDGVFNYPHIRQDSPFQAQVEQQMTYLMNSPTHGIKDIQDPQQKLAKAYELAINYVPDIQAETQAAAEKAKAQERNQQALSLKNASVKTNSKSKDAPEVMPSFDDRLKQQLGI